MRGDGRLCVWGSCETRGSEEQEEVKRKREGFCRLYSRVGASMMQLQGHLNMKGVRDDDDDDDDDDGDGDGDDDCLQIICYILKWSSRCRAGYREQGIELFSP